jgi:cytoskeletal protein RodZ
MRRILEGGRNRMGNGLWNWINMIPLKKAEQPKPRPPSSSSSSSSSASSNSTKDIIPLFCLL